MKEIKVQLDRYIESDSSWCHFGIHKIKKGSRVVMVTFPKWMSFDLCLKHARKAGLIK